jgi:hypothetical protein
MNTAGQTAVRGRRPKRATKLVRLPADLANKLGAVAWWDRDLVIADFLASLTREAIERRFNALPENVQAAALARVAGEVRAAAPQGG